jgi:hypothetical protein
VEPVRSGGSASRRGGDTPGGKPSCNCTALGISFSEFVRDSAIDRIWADASNYVGMGQYAKGAFALPEASSSARRFYPKIVVTPVDDTTSTRVTIRGSRFIDSGRVHARLCVVTNTGTKYYLESSEPIKPSGSDGVELTFPTLTPLAKSKTDLGDGSALLLSYASSQYRWDDTDPFVQTPGLSTKEIADLNKGQEVAYPATIFFTTSSPK